MTCHKPLEKKTKRGLDHLIIEDYEMDAEPSQTTKAQATKTLAQWLIRHRMLTQEKRKALTLPAQDVS